jgi:hypothetical protein
MGRLFLAAAFVVAGLSLIGQNATPNLVPVQTVVTVEARHDHDDAVPSLKQEYERKDRPW